MTGVLHARSQIPLAQSLISAKRDLAVCQALPPAQAAQSSPLGTYPTSGGTRPSGSWCKGQSDQKCWGLGLGYCGGYGGFGSYGFDPFGLYTLGLSSLYGYGGLAFGAGSLYGYGYGYHGYGGGLLMKDAPGAGKTPSVSASLISPFCLCS
ncbi:hypothetical protein PTTG_00096 [Puccinia triticina 1-1 BBBD Race 1]|uniref:Uncharacterized protein n=1 Tax=Puccinia triticina (isolate 1-1 / race 1 (BBBD)) TaxID=630390 RepID=A0A180GYB4_PUCT1|nr:hypothetical protein PTTG_00096 [Puccinia triticina 1-1 BBBD Race 1]